MKRDNGKGTRERAEKQQGSWQGNFFLGNIVLPVNREKTGMDYKKIVV